MLKTYPVRGECVRILHYGGVPDDPHRVVDDEGEEKVFMDLYPGTSQRSD